jgi:putative peptidoglycan lipid II flippase
VRILAPAFYAVQDTKTPVKIAVVSLLANVALSLILMGPLKHGGLALANSLASMVNFLLLFVWLRKRIGEIHWAKVLRSLLQVGVASTVMGWAAHWIIGGTSWVGPGYWGEKILLLGAGIGAGFLIYICIAYLLKNGELSFLIDMLLRKRRPLSFDG